jgi:nitronate monooxygenase
VLNTELTKLFSLRYPIVLAPMCWGYTSGDLAAAVTEAGGLGLFGGINVGGPEWVREQLRVVRSRTDGAFGVGFITWWLPQFAANFEVCLDERVPVLAFSFGDPAPYVARAKEVGALVVCQVQNRRGRVWR